MVLTGMPQFGNGGFIFMVHCEQAKFATMNIGRKYGFMSRIAKVFGWDDDE